MANAPVKLTNAEFKIVCDYIREVADELGLRDWVIYVKRESAPDGCNGMIRDTEGRKLAEIYLCEDFRERNHDEQKNTIVHELLHCHFAPMGWTTKNLLKTDGHISAHEWNMFYESMKLGLEYAIDGLATALSPGFHAIPWERK